MMLPGISHCWGVIDHRVSLKMVGRKERGGAWARCGGRGRVTKLRVRGSHQLQLLVSFLPSELH